MGGRLFVRVLDPACSCWRAPDTIPYLMSDRFMSYLHTSFVTRKLQVTALKGNNSRRTHGAAVASMRKKKGK